MKKNWMNRAAAFCLLPSLLAGCAGSAAFSAMPAYAQEAVSAEEEITEEPDTEQQSDGILASEDLSEMSPEVLLELLKTAGELDFNGILETLQWVNNLINSEEFESLIKYPEVKDLIKILIERGYNFMLEDEDLSRKILDTAGLSESEIYVVMLILSMSDEERDVIIALLESEQGQEALAYISENADEDTMLELLRAVTSGSMDTVEMIIEAQTYIKEEILEEEGSVEAEPGTEEETAENLEEGTEPREDG